MSEQKMERGMMTGQRKLQAMNEAWQAHGELREEDDAAFRIGFEEGWSAASTPEAAGRGERDVLQVFATEEAARLYARKWTTEHPNATCEVVRVTEELAAVYGRTN